MKKAFSTLACPTLSLDEVLVLAKRNGMDAVEIRLDRENRLCGYVEEDAAEISQKLTASGITITDLGTGISFDGNGSKVAEVEVCARLARAVGVRALRVFVGAFVAAPVMLSDEDVERTAREIDEGARCAAKYGIELWLETHSAYSTGESIARLLTCTKETNVHVIWDIMHSIEFGEAPADTVKALGREIVHVHLKDGVPPQEGDGTHYTLTALGEGAVDFHKIATALSSIGYAGALSLEWELMWHPELGACYPSTDALLQRYCELLREFFE